MHHDLPPPYQFNRMDFPAASDSEIASLHLATYDWAVTYGRVRWPEELYAPDAGTGAALRGMPASGIDGSMMHLASIEQRLLRAHVPDVVDMLGIPPSEPGKCMLQVGYRPAQALLINPDNSQPEHFSRPATSFIIRHNRGEGRRNGFAAYTLFSDSVIGEPGDVAARHTVSREFDQIHTVEPRLRTIEAALLRQLITCLGAVAAARGGSRRYWRLGDNTASGH